jgi:UDP-glucose 4-epimerase
LKLIESKRANGREQEEELLLPRLQNFIFSSSATVYGDVKFHGFEVPIKETTPLLAPTSPYGESKLLVEKLLRQFIESDRIVNGDVKLKVGVLRYFNPIGAHSSGLIGEDSLGKPTNLLPILGGIAIVKWKDQKLRKNMETSTPAEINVYGIDYDTVDGTPIRDYIHIEDLSSGHLSCLNYLKNLEDGETFYREWNLGTGRGYTVLEIIDEFNKNVGVEIQHRLVDRRPGDVEILLANPDRAISELHWSCQRSIADACKDLWSWLKNLHSQ